MASGIAYCGVIWMEVWILDGEISGSGSWFFFFLFFFSFFLYENFRETLSCKVLISGFC